MSFSIIRGKISRDEAIDQIKENFSIIDNNGDGGIDLDELTEILRIQGSSR